MSHALEAAGLPVVIGSWVVMLTVVTVRHLQLRRAAATRRVSSRAGLLLQVLGYVRVFAVRAEAAPFQAWSVDPALLTLVASAMSVAGAALVIAAQRYLGVHWSLTARLVPGHRLVTGGPFAYLRHPVYAGMILMLVGTGMALATPLGTVSAFAAYIAGTVIRIRSEEALLHEAFGEAWTAYARRVPRLVPRLLRRTV